MATAACNHGRQSAYGFMGRPHRRHCRDRVYSIVRARVVDCITPGDHCPYVAALATSPLARAANSFLALVVQSTDEPAAVLAFMLAMGTTSVLRSPRRRRCGTRAPSAGPRRSSRVLTAAHRLRQGRVQLVVANRVEDAGRGGDLLGQRRHELALPLGAAMRPKAGRPCADVAEGLGSREVLAAFLRLVWESASTIGSFRHMRTPPTASTTPTKPPKPTST